MQTHPGRSEAFQVVEQHSADHDDGRDATTQDLTLTEAASRYRVSLATLRRLVAAGELGAWKVSGARGREWRVSPSALAEAGYTRREIDPADEGPSPEVRRVTEALLTERAKVARLDSELGYALLTIGRFRGRLLDAGIDPDELIGGEA
jgi:excisionase family DNA binding protein